MWNPTLFLLAGLIAGLIAIIIAIFIEVATLKLFSKYKGK